MLDLVFYETDSGNCPVERYIRSCDAASRALLLEKLKAFCEEFPEIQTVSIKHMRGKIWEMRVRDVRGQEHRFLYSIVSQDLVVLHAFTKKTRKTPPGDLALAERRLRAMTE